MNEDINEIEQSEVDAELNKFADHSPINTRLLAIADAEKRIRTNPNDANYVAQQQAKIDKWTSEIDAIKLQDKTDEIGTTEKLEDLKKMQRNLFHAFESTLLPAFLTGQAIVVPAIRKHDKKQVFTLLVVNGEDKRGTSIKFIAELFHEDNALDGYTLIDFEGNPMKVE